MDLADWNFEFNGEYHDYRLTNPRTKIYKNIHPGRLTWNLRIHPWKRKSSSNSPFSGSMLIFGGVQEISLPCQQKHTLMSTRTYSGSPSNAPITPGAIFEMYRFPQTKKPGNLIKVTRNFNEQNLAIHQGTIGCTPNSVPKVFVVFSRDSWGL